MTNAKYWKVPFLRLRDNTVTAIRYLHCQALILGAASYQRRTRRGTLAEWHIAVPPQELNNQNCKSRASQDSLLWHAKGAPKAGISGETGG
jgi:hypothetical protein